MNIAAAVSAMRELPPEQLLDLAIARLRVALPDPLPPPTEHAFNPRMLPVAGLVLGAKP